MLHYLKIEWLKIKSYRTFWILIGIFISLYFIWNYHLSGVFDSLNSNAIKVHEETYTFPKVWNTTAYVYSWFIFFLCMFIIINITNEFTFKTIRQHIIDGWQRLEFIHSKAILILSLSIFSTIFYTIVTLIFGFVNGGDGAFEKAYIICYVFIYTLNYLSFSALLAIFCKKTGITIVLFFSYLLIESGLSIFLNSKFEYSIGNLLPLQSSDELLPLKSLTKIKNFIDQATSQKNISALCYLISSVFYIILYYIIARRKMLKSDF